MDKSVYESIIKALEGRTMRSAWDNGVNAYALELLESIKDQYANVDSYEDLRTALLNGARNWDEYSQGGCSLIYNSDICERLCPPGEQKRKRGGELEPNSRESWLDVQARALQQACTRIVRTYKQLRKGGIA